MKTVSASPIRSPRWVAVESLARSVRKWPDLMPDPPDVSPLDDQDARLALAIHGTVMRRWLTLEHLTQRFLRQPLGSIEPTLKAILLAGAGQLLFMDRLPVYAVVDESVKIARHRVRPGSAGLVNAVLRRITESRGPTEVCETWTPASDTLPTNRGVVKLNGPYLPDPSDLAGHLRAATSHPGLLIRRWLNTFGPEATTRICRHCTQLPPVLLAAVDTERCHEVNEFLEPHNQRGFHLWTGPRVRLMELLARFPHVRVQDPASARPVAAAVHAGLDPDTILDFCAGSGTKTRQLASAYPNARILATEPDRRRFQRLERSCHAFPNVEVLQPAAVESSPMVGKFSLALVDAPCSNTAVLARRPEARYRFKPASLASLVRLQRDILTTVLPWVRPGGHVLYCTCSLEPEENHQQSQWLQESFGFRLVNQEQMQPAGSQVSYHDGGYFALLQKPV